MERSESLYLRGTEIRHVRPSDVHDLAVILDLSSGTNDGKKLMEIVPKKHSSTNSVGQSVSMHERLKFSPQQIREIENSANLSYGTRLFTEIFLEEWGTMGLREERPTVGLLLQLLIKAELWQGADFVAQHFLNEPPPERPSVGPAARVNIDFSVEDFNDIGSMIYDGYPSTEDLNVIANSAQSTMGNNKDHLIKYQPTDKDITPKPPPRRKRTQQSQSADGASTAEAQEQSGLQQQDRQQENVSIVSIDDNTTESTGNIPAISFLNANSSTNTQSTYITETDIPSANIPILNMTNEIAFFESSSNNYSRKSSMSTNQPLLSLLNMNGESQTSNTPCSFSEISIILSQDSRNGEVELLKQTFHDNEEASEEDDDLDDNMLPSNLEQSSSNNESSLTTVTGTSGDNSFESTNDSSSCSNENIPCITGLLR